MLDIEIYLTGIHGTYVTKFIGTENRYDVKSHCLLLNICTCHIYNDRVSVCQYKNV